MKYLLNHILLFCYGFVIAAIVNFSFSCTGNNSSTQPQDQNNSEYSETQAMRNLSDGLIAAFKSENKDDIINYLSDNKKDVYSGILINSTQKLSDFGTALEKRKLVFANKLYAEYEITINGEIYTIAYGNGGDDVWKLLRL
ncbi:MAG: hypothetical protein KJO26_10810 [Deltaproteobacteria bacterium]|nr:hypothetical protein [Deltaproteobacteria bacterium]